MIEECKRTVPGLPQTAPIRRYADTPNADPPTRPIADPPTRRPVSAPARRPVSAPAGETDRCRGVSPYQRSWTLGYSASLGRVLASPTTPIRPSPIRRPVSAPARRPVSAAGRGDVSAFHAYRGIEEGIKRDALLTAQASGGMGKGSVPARRAGSCWCCQRGAYRRISILGFLATRLLSTGFGFAYRAERRTRTRTRTIERTLNAKH
jgi:hypothetical protein